MTKKYFGLSLQPNYDGLVTFAIIEINAKGEVVNRVFLGRQNWMHQIVGMQQSVANPEGKNLLKEAGIKGPEVMDDVWRLRYSESPYDSTPVDKGWAAKPRMPSDGQMQMLQKFGVKTINDYFYGQNLYNLLKAMDDPGWVSEYQNK